MSKSNTDLIPVTNSPPVLDEGCLHNYQQFCVTFLEMHPQCALFLDCGLGKTVITLTAIQHLMYDSFDVNRVLIIAPLRVARDTWIAELSKWAHLPRPLSLQSPFHHHCFGLASFFAYFHEFPIELCINLDIQAGMIFLCTRHAGAWSTYRLFHSGMETPVPVANGGTGASSASSARENLGLSDASNLTSGTLPAGRLPFKFAYGSTSINGSSATYVNYSSAGFTSTPVVLVTYSTSGSNWSGDNGAIKVHSKTTYGCSIIVGGNFSTSRAVDWFAFGN